MPQIGNNNEPLLERALFVFDGTLWRPLSANTSGQLVTALASGSTIIATQATPASLQAAVNINTDQNVQARMHGYDGTTWRKLQQLWGYTDTCSEALLNPNAAAGTNNVDGTAVAAGYVHKITNIVALDNNTAPTQIYIGCVIDGTQLILQQFPAPGMATYAHWGGELTLGAGDIVRVIFTGCALNDDLYVDIVGYKMRIND